MAITKGTKVFFVTLGVLLSVAICTKGQQIHTVEVGPTRYFISDSSPYSPRLNWFLAYQYCRNIGMELLTLPRQEEALELMSFLEESGKSQEDYWTSSNQLGSPMWIWMTTGHPLNSTFSFWERNGPPLTKTQQSCMNLKQRTWSASNCMDEKSFICQLTRCYYFNYVVTNKAITTTTRQGNNQTSSTRSPFSSSPSFPSLNNPSNNRPINRQPIIGNGASIPFNGNQNNAPKQHVEGTSNLARNPTTDHLHSFTPSVDKLGDQLRAPPSPIERADLQNEIVPAVSKFLVVPLSQELAPPRVTSISGIHRGNSVIFPETMRTLRRKEAFSWALADGVPTHQ